jgi:hypothetical protein
MILIHHRVRALLTLTFAVACAALAVIQPSWIAELEAQSYSSPGIVSIKGDAEKLGSANAKVTLERTFTFAGGLGDLRQTTLTIDHVVTEAGLNLVAGAQLPLLLSPSRGGKATGVIFRTAEGARPKVVAELKAKGNGLFTLRLVLEFADSIPPAFCAGSPPTTNITTRVIVRSPTATVPVTSTLAWKCVAGGTELVIEKKLLACAHDLCETGTALNPSCDQCAASICAVDPFCCNFEWDGLCVDEVGFVCGYSCDLP